MDSPVQQRRSRKIAPVEGVDEEVLPEELNDIENELYQSRKQAENNLRNNSAVDKRLSVSEKSISEHFQSCIQLAAENKINPKNAFNFKLIDLLHSMLSKKKQIKDFTEVSSSLDAGVKIYSCRVDNVHSDTLKMATSICANNKQKNENSDEDDTQAYEQGKVQKKKFIRRTRKTTLAVTPDLINRASVNEQETIPNSILSNENFIINSAIFDSSKICWHLNTTLNFWKGQELCTPVSRNNVSIELPVIAEDAVICRTFNGFRFGDESTTLELSIKEKVSMAYDFKMENRNDDFFDYDTLPLDDNRENTPEYEEPRTQVEYLSKMMSSSDFISDISKLIMSEKSEYRYFNSQLLQKNWNFKNMKHWNPFKRKKTEEKRVKSDKRELIDFDDLEDFSIFEKKLNVSLTVGYVAPREKYLITPVTHFNINEFFRLNLWREMYVIPTTNTSDEQPSDLEEMINDYDYDNPNDSQNQIPEPYEDDYCDDDRTSNDIHEVIEKTTALVGDNLVEIPNKISKIQLPYMVKDKSVNMKRLKLKIWNQIESSEISTKLTADEDKIHFSNICKVILLEDDKSHKEELSIPILFNAILQLANDKNLFFNTVEENLTDFQVIVSKNDS